MVKEIAYFRWLVGQAALGATQTKLDVAYFRSLVGQLHWVPLD